MTYTQSNAELLETLQAMRRQEESGYRSQPDVYSDGELMFCQPQHAPVDSTCRIKMAEWCYNVIDFCKFNRETVAIAMNFLDRFMATPTGRDLAMSDRKAFQLASMTCLYTAVKINEPQAIEPTVIARLSRGAYTRDEIEEMERRIVVSLQWRMHPPTAISFVRQFMALLPKGGISEMERETAFELAKFQTELAVTDSWFLGDQDSKVALAALSNALHFTSLSLSSICDFVHYVKQAANIHSDNQNLHDAEDRLYCSLESSSPVSLEGTASPKILTKPDCDQKICPTGSPRSVSATEIQEASSRDNDFKM
jgi:hypothetical protein